MAASRPTRRDLAAARGQPSQQMTQGQVIPAPMKGIVANTPLSEMSMDSSVATVNMLSDAYGLRVRQGYREWCPPIDDGFDTGIRTIIPANTNEVAGTIDHLFAVTQDGIYEIESGLAPVKRVDWPAKGEEAGWCSWHNFTNISNFQYVLICDLQNGYWVYDFVNDTFSQIITGTAPGTINGSDPTNFVFVTVWKNRVWFVQRDSTRAWYLETVGIFTGKVVAFDFGAKMKYGGYLKGMYSWTLDAGMGVDDHLVAISSQGDLVIYTGTDPTSASSFQMRGVWFLGESPRGRRGVSDYGGDLLVASQFGIIPLSRLVQGIDPGVDVQEYVTARVNPLYSQRYEERRNLFGFEIRSLPEQNAIIVVWPKTENTAPVQLVYHIPTRSWSVYVGVPALTMEHYQSKTFFGTLENQIFIMENGADNRTIDDPTTATEVRFALLTAFSYYGAPARYKRVQFLRPIFVADSVPTYSIAARYDYDISDPLAVPPPGVDQDSAVWDNSLWDQAVWSGGYQLDQPVRGGAGMGRSVAVLLSGTTSSDSVTLAGIEIMMDGGGLL